MSFLALLALALGQQPCPHASKPCPHAQTKSCQEARGCLVQVEAEDEIDMGDAEILADPMDDRVIRCQVVGDPKPKHTLSLGFAFGKETPSGVTIVFTKKKEEVAKEERVQATLYSFGPVVTRSEVSLKDAAKGCPAAKCTDGKAASATCDQCPAAKGCPAAKCADGKAASAACDHCPAAKAAACDQCPAGHCDGSKACDACPACPAAGAAAKSTTASGIIQVQGVSLVSATATEQGKPARRRLIRRR